ncbi:MULTISPECIES: NAD(P)-dependent oxidoreductase [Anaerococcus]|jgi:D-isomer specific 2-hydroxyacid dehydrogenase NAD-binding|uniref:NAD(P)-dependent oxidoreductase n=1 Tax=Anaerococcus TaxID=165779 RepID=UPI001AE40713|nr:MULTISPECIES: NAD(P)-dependent oxidoreductase [Anaerococcus]MBP2069510.1 D-3-phosphoglycerate dehydrogenase [Anaerococcus nagyae]MDU1828376.1 NAD(P)-dependent oxidoreductase [Anaerococcus sp.]MDU1864179.1 NAD(P)-dependent oxidoreductase [Anaerococcus sp.]MDU2354501.1 NAD(P)-dependent oxidoreductase [Anaerococcus sp.]
MKITLLNPLEVKEEIILDNKNKLEEMGHEFDYYDSLAKDDDEIIERLKDSDIAIITNKPLSANVIDNCQNLEMIDVAFTGVDHVDLDAVKKNGITLLNASGYSDDSVAELVIGLIIAVMRKFNENKENIFEDTNNSLMGETLKGKKIGIIGTGNIGIKLIELLKVFGCDILAYSRTEKEDVKAMGVSYVDLDTLLKESDVVSLHIPNNNETKGFLGKDELDKMKDNAILINCARGPVVDNDYLAKLLNEDKLRAGIDVFDMEPPLPKDYSLRNAKNVILTNHVAFYTKEAMENRAKIVFDNIYKYLDGNVINEIKL